MPSKMRQFDMSASLARNYELPHNPLVNPRKGDVVAFLQAHPDDESLFIGGTIARLAKAGVETVLVMATLGELGRPPDPSVQARLSDDVRLGEVRKEELGRACAALGVSHHEFLGGEGRFSDSGVDPCTRSDTSFARQSSEAALELTMLLRRLRPQVLVTFDRDGCTGHPDHVACYQIAVRAVAALSASDDRLCGLALIADPLGLQVGSVRRPLIGIDVTEVRDRKAQAVACHFSQVADALEDHTRLARFKPGSTAGLYIPHMLSSPSRSRYERYGWISRTELAGSLEGAPDGERSRCSRFFSPSRWRRPASDGQSRPIPARRPRQRPEHRHS